MGEGEENVEDKKVKDISLKDLSKILEDFAKARDWEKHHSPRNLLLAMVGEVGELSEIFQWRGEVEKGLPNWEEADKEHLGEELSDVLLYLISPFPLHHRPFFHFFLQSPLRFIEAEKWREQCLRRHWRA
ncbi:hypothetical protein QYF36_018485 [Acer negundo]|nr:hypothetical protein QYF36_018485 [Acer negundo]